MSVCVCECDFMLQYATGLKYPVVQKRVYSFYSCLVFFLAKTGIQSLHFYGLIPQSGRKVHL